MQVGSSTANRYGASYSNSATGAANKTKDYLETYKALLERQKSVPVEERKAPMYQIGAQEITEEEWEELLDKYDAIQEEVRELMKEEQERLEKLEELREFLTEETTSCVYETEDEDLYYETCYSAEGIFCKKIGAGETVEWSILFENPEQYEKVMEFIGQFPDDWNLRFAAHENFWNDFLNDEIDMDGFMEFMNGTDKGVPDFSITKGDSMYIDESKVQWAKYTNPLGVRIYTAEEIQKIEGII